MDLDPVERARRRLSSLRGEGPSREAIEATLGRAQQALADLTERASVLETALPEQVSRGIHDAIEREVLPVARNLAEVRGLSSQIVRKLEGVEDAVASERRARVDDLEVLVDLVVAGWEGIDARLERIEHALAGLAAEPRVLAEDSEPSPVRASASLLRLDERRPTAAS